MDIQVLNEIANPARQTALSQVNPSVSANAQLKALKGSPVSVLESPAPPSPEDTPEQNQDPVTPNISPVARAASNYSAAVGDGLSSDELSAIQDLAVRVRTAVSDFLNQPGLEQAESAADVVASNPEAVQSLTSSVEQAVVETLNLTGSEGEFIVNAAPSKEDVFVEVPVSSEQSISVERITNGAEFNNETQVIVASPALVNSRATENASVENPVTVEEVPESSRGDYRVTAAIPELQNAPATENAQVETPVSSAVVASQESVSHPEIVATNQQEVPVTASSPELQNAQTNENTQVKTSASPPQVAAVSQQEPVSRSETVAARPQEVPETTASPELQSTSTDESTQVQTRRAVETPSQESINPPETVATNQPQVSVASEGPILQNAPAHNAEVGNPVTIPATPTRQGQEFEESLAQSVNPEGAGSQEAPVPVNPQLATTPPQAGPAPSNDLFAQESAVVNPENIRDVNELVGSVLDNEFTSEAKKIFSEPKVIRTVADLADFILERLREIIATKQQQPQSSNDVNRL